MYVLTGGSEATGGGFIVTDDAPNIIITRSRPEGTGGYEVSYQKVDTDPPSGTPTVRVHVNCISTEPVTAIATATKSRAARNKGK